MPSDDQTTQTPASDTSDTLVRPDATTVLASAATTVATSTPYNALTASPTPALLAATTTSTPSGQVLADRSYVVQEGDTLSGIAVQFDTTVDALIQVNSLASADVIYAGQTLRILQPATSPLPVVDTTAVELLPTALPNPDPTRNARPVVINGRTYDAYNQAAIKKGQWYQYTCEFDAAWVVLKTYGFDVGLAKQVEIVGLDKSIEPYYRETKNGVVIYGGDVTVAYSGNYKSNFLARSSGQAMRKVFEYYDLAVTPVRDRPSLEAALLRGELVWIKTTVDFKPWIEATWVMPDGRSYKTVLGNDHALVVMGFNKAGVVIRDPLGPTSTGRTRPYEYTVAWPKFMASWGAQEFDGLAVAPPGQ